MAATAVVLGLSGDHEVPLLRPCEGLEEVDEDLRFKSWAPTSSKDTKFLPSLLGSVQRTRGFQGGFV